MSTTEKQAPAKWAMESAKKVQDYVRNIFAGGSATWNAEQVNLAEIIERESPVGKLTDALRECILSHSATSPHGRTLFCKCKSCEQSERVLRELGVENDQLR